MPYSINKKKCLRCGLCIKGCPENAISGIEHREKDGLILYDTNIDPMKCSDCGVCVSHEYWCPAQAIYKVTT